MCTEKPWGDQRKYHETDCKGIKLEAILNEGKHRKEVKS
jgi:hypothetical protein